MIEETDPYGPRDLETDDDDDFGRPQGVADAMEELDRAVMEDMRRGVGKKKQNQRGPGGKMVLWDRNTGTVEDFHKKRKAMGVPSKGTEDDRRTNSQ